VFEAPKLFSFGVSKIMDQETGKVTGLSLPLCMWNKDGATEEERAFSDTIEQVVERCKDHLVLEDTKIEVKKFNLKRDALDSIGNFYYRKLDEKGKILADRGPVLYPKLIESRKNGQHKIVTNFFDQNGRDIDPMSLEKKYCWVNAAIKIESIYVGAKISLQVKVYEAEVSLVESGARRLLRRPQSDASVVAVTPSAPSSSVPLTDPQEEDEEQIHDDDSHGGGGGAASAREEPAPPSPVPAPSASAPVRKVVRRVVAAGSAKK
jgi:hypothetical protein